MESLRHTKVRTLTPHRAPVLPALAPHCQRQLWQGLLLETAAHIYLSNPLELRALQ